MSTKAVGMARPACAGLSEGCPGGLGLRPLAALLDGTAPSHSCRCPRSSPEGVAPSSPVDWQGRRDQLEQGLLVMPPRGNHEAPDVALAEQQVMMLDQPRTGARHELGLVEDGGRFPTKIGYQPACGM